VFPDDGGHTVLNWSRPSKSIAEAEGASASAFHLTVRQFTQLGFTACAGRRMRRLEGHTETDEIPSAL
jgi:hypothetical protein